MRFIRHKTVLLLPAILLIPIAAGTAFAETSAKPETVNVFEPKRDGYASIRIPALLTTLRGTLLAFAEGRSANSDQASNKLILKRSTDGGKSWGPLQQVLRDGKNSLNNPCVVEERSTGRILVVIQSYPAGGSEFNGKLKPGVEGPLTVRNYLLASDDDGVAWTPPKDITATTKAADAVTVASGPGIGIQLAHGPQQGRLIVPFNQRVGPFWDVRAVYSDDRGATWRLGELVPGARAVNAKGRTTSMVNEAQMVELQDGSVLMNSRRADDKPFRKAATSRDGGQTWSSVEQSTALADPACMGSILRYSFAANTRTDSAMKSIILFASPNSTKRANGTVHVSYDEGRTWPASKVLQEGRFGYCCLTRMQDGRAGILYETGLKKTEEVINFTCFPIDWLVP
jgi:sialidase-1